MDLLSKEEATIFVENVLGLTDIQMRLNTDKLSFLNDIIYEYHCKVPFHNLDVLALPVSERRIPNLTELKERGLSGRGGLCYQNNTFLYFVLRVLGYDISLAKGQVDIPGDHVLLVAHDVVMSDDNYLIEAGMGYPTLKAIPLDFQDESPVYTFSFCTFKYVHQNGGEFYRMHKEKSDVENTWRQVYRFNSAHCILKDFESSMVIPYTDPTSIFLNSFRAVRFPNGKLLAIKNSSILEDKNDRVVSTKLKDSEALTNALCLLFPMVSNPKEVMQSAVEMIVTF
ncbi:arylamine N-acetyltransferase 1 [Lingula anatina]|uniref:arylamine N-acetyltransferase n=1 Tax=Lingula anatina TaxID=7574 RepID=A0A1S3IAA1_LINAN|nr:arylamine N-acetyltransferase 1 [Lingula anatina]XP_013394786.1 arylamine N-acetyltransferase 1 [Lingula anatina]|eukprot:XP_013394785.1 arylamine N-acetyltransferase 1 [Lingula anatina]